MIDYTDIDAKLDEYSEAFDFYMESGEMPPGVSDDDCLAGYMREVIDNNPQIDCNDTTWAEVLKDDLITFFHAILEQFRAIQIEALKELDLIAQFCNAPIEKKRLLWQEVSETIQSGYSKYDINLPGFTAQFQSTDKEAVFAALTSDWENACKEKLSRMQRQLLERSKQNFEAICRDCGIADYEDKIRLDNYIHQYPQLEEIVNLIGRDKDPIKDEKDAVIYKFMPMSISKNNSFEEIDRIECGDNIERLLPVELSLPEDVFFKRYVTKGLQQFSSPSKEKPKKVDNHREDPRLTKGPIIVSIDTSGSMYGNPQKIAFSLLKQLLRMAKRQKRPCFLISFSVRAKSIDLSNPRNWGKLNYFLEHSFSGGTDGEEMLGEAIRVLQKGTFEMADVLIISDLQFPLPVSATLAKINREKNLGTRFYALQIGKLSHGYKKVMDKIWQV